MINCQKIQSKDWKGIMHLEYWIQKIKKILNYLKKLLKFNNSFLNHHKKTIKKLNKCFKLVELVILKISDL